MRIHFILEPAPAEEFLALGRLAEELGFDAVWTANHASAPDPFLAFSLLACESSQIRLGPVAVSPYELHPLKIANSLFTLNQFANGRANIVIGGGGGTLIAMHLKGGRYVMHERMVRGVRECIEFLKLASAEQALDYAGEVFQVDGYQPGWATAPPPCIYVGATKPQMLRMAARVADGVMFSDLTAGRLDETFAILNAALTEHHRARGFHINNLYAWHVKKNRDAAAAEPECGSGSSRGVCIIRFFEEEIRDWFRNQGDKQDARREYTGPSRSWPCPRSAGAFRRAGRNGRA